jgi:hypothetical protein
LATTANDRLGAIAVANLDNEEIAVKRLFEWLNDPQNSKLTAAFRYRRKRYL